MQELYRQLSVIASTLCDKQMDAEKVDALFAAVGEPVWKLVDADGIGFYNDEEWGDTYVLYQPNDLTHIITTHTDSGEQ